MQQLSQKACPQNVITADLINSEQIGHSNASVRLIAKSRSSFAKPPGGEGLPVEAVVEIARISVVKPTKLLVWDVQCGIFSHFFASYNQL